MFMDHFELFRLSNNEAIGDGELCKGEIFTKSIIFLNLILTMTVIGGIILSYHVDTL